MKNNLVRTADAHTLLPWHIRNDLEILGMDRIPQSLFDYISGILDKLEDYRLTLSQEEDIEF